MKNPSTLRFRLSAHVRRFRNLSHSLLPALVIYLIFRYCIRN
jgi:hypothetical protein